jgi:hypothetical protein
MDLATTIYCWASSHIDRYGYRTDLYSPLFGEGCLASDIGIPAVSPTTEFSETSQLAREWLKLSNRRLRPVYLNEFVKRGAHK